MSINLKQLAYIDCIIVARKQTLGVSTRTKMVIVLQQLYVM